MYLYLAALAAGTDVVRQLIRGLFGGIFAEIDRKQVFMIAQQRVDETAGHFFGIRADLVQLTVKHAEDIVIMNGEFTQLLKYVLSIMDLI